MGSQQRNSESPNRRSMNSDAPPNLPYARRPSISGYRPPFMNVIHVASPMNVHNLPYGPFFNPYAPSPYPIANPYPLVNYLPYPVSGPGYPPALITPGTAEEDLIVMDGIPPSMSSTGGSELSTTGASHSNYGGGRPVSTTPLAGAAGIETIDTGKKKPCAYWLRGTCRFGSNCWNAHSIDPPGEPQRPPCSSGEVFSSSSNLQGSASSSYGKIDSPIIQPKSTSAAEEAFSVPSVPAAMAFSTAPAQVEDLSGGAITSSTAPEVYQPRSDWSPLDDGIEIGLPFAENLRKEDVNAYIRALLSGTTQGRDSLCLSKFAGDTSGDGEA